MMAAVTYNGVASAEGGNIFKDMNFWVALRIPCRKHFIEQVESNGGKIVPLEKQADMLIADHVRPKFAPPGSYSWKYIEDSLKNGIAQLKDRYLIGLDPTLPRPAGGGAGTKSTRTPFTQADDRVLAKWVLTHGADRAGNAIYQELAAKNHRHTWQSWRDRFVKQLRILPKETLRAMADLAPEEPVDAENTEAEEKPKMKPQEPAKQHSSQPRKKAPTRQTKVAEPPASGPEPVPESNPQVAEETQINDQQPGQQPMENVEAGSDSLGMKDQFYQDLNEYIEATEADIKLQPKISDRTMELYDLFLAVQKMQQERDLEALSWDDWSQIAQSLGFLPGDDVVISQLQQCYDDSLVEFLDAMKHYKSDGEADEAESNFDRGFSDDRELVQPQESDWVEESPSHQALVRQQQNYIRSSPPIRTKRPLDQLPLTSSGPLTKRTRFGKEAVIPSTPDMVVGKGRRVPSPQYLSPSIRKSLMHQDYVDASEASQQLPPLPPADEDELGNDDDEGEEEPEDQKLPLKSIMQKSPLLDTEDVSAHHTPSQQPHSEALNHSPIPFSLSRPSQTKRVFGRSVSNPVQNSNADPSSQRHELDSRRTTMPSTNPITKVVQAAKVSRRSLPSSFGSKTATGELSFNQGSSTPALAATPPKRQPSKAHSAPQPAQSSSNHRNIDQWIQHYEALGFSRSIVIEGLKRTTLTPGTLAGVVMQKLQKGEEVPSNYEGIWTDRDDADLQFIGTIDFSREPVGPVEERQYRRARKAAKRLDAKHNEKRIELRRAFLEAQGMGEQGDGLDE